MWNTKRVVRLIVLYYCNVTVLLTRHRVILREMAVEELLWRYPVSLRFALVSSGQMIKVSIAERSIPRINTRRCALYMFKDGRKSRFSVGWLMRFIAALMRDDNGRMYPRSGAEEKEKENEREEKENWTPD